MSYVCTQCSHKQNNGLWVHSPGFCREYICKSFSLHQFSEHTPSALDACWRPHLNGCSTVSRRSNPWRGLGSEMLDGTKMMWNSMVEVVAACQIKSCVQKAALVQSLDNLRGRNHSTPDLETTASWGGGGMCHRTTDPITPEPHSRDSCSNQIGNGFQPFLNDMLVLLVPMPRAVNNYLMIPTCSLFSLPYHGTNCALIRTQFPFVR